MIEGQQCRFAGLKCGCRAASPQNLRRCSTGKGTAVRRGRKHVRGDGQTHPRDGAVTGCWNLALMRLHPTRPHPRHARASPRFLALLHPPRTGHWRCHNPRRCVLPTRIAQQRRQWPPLCGYVSCRAHGPPVRRQAHHVGSRN